MVGNRLPRQAKVCEIGCGMGGILVPFKMAGMDVQGVDLGEEFIQAGKDFNINIQNGDADSLLAQGSRFDLIIINHVLERIPSVHEFTGKIKQLLNENGLLYVAVPGVKTVSSSYQYDFLMYLQNAHCWHFTRNTLTALLIADGFEVLDADESVRCLARKTAQKPQAISLENEWKEVVGFLKQTECIHRWKLQRAAAFVAKVKRKLKKLKEGCCW